MLQKRLQQALQMHLQPRTSVNTESPADKTLRLLDSLLQVHQLTAGGCDKACKLDHCHALSSCFPVQTVAAFQPRVQDNLTLEGSDAWLSVWGAFLLLSIDHAGDARS